MTSRSRQAAYSVREEREAMDVVLQALDGEHMS